LSAAESIRHLVLPACWALLAAAIPVNAHACKAQGSFFDYRNCQKPAERPKEPEPTARPATQKPKQVKASPTERPEKPVPGGPDSSFVLTDLAGRSLTLGCIAGKAALVFDFATPMSAEGYRKEIYFALDGGEPRIAELSPAKRETALGIWQDYRAAPLITEILKSDLLTVEATSASGEELTLQFSIDGDARKAAQLRRSCRL
jgi:hypothetical protein